jgi:hypothetical protein
MCTSYTPGIICLGFLALKGTPDFEHTSTLMMFYDTFYSRLFDIHPVRNASYNSSLTVKHTIEFTRALA